jgi:hypothetical protein
VIASAIDALFLVVQFHPRDQCCVVGQVRLNSGQGVHLTGRHAVSLTQLGLIADEFRLGDIPLLTKVNRAGVFVVRLKSGHLAVQLVQPFEKFLLAATFLRTDGPLSQIIQKSPRQVLLECFPGEFRLSAASSDDR